jgi:hypothetical protein
MPPPSGAAAPATASPDRNSTSPAATSPLHREVQKLQGDASNKGMTRTPPSPAPKKLRFSPGSLGTTRVGRNRSSTNDAIKKESDARRRRHRRHRGARLSPGARFDHKALGAATRGEWRCRHLPNLPPRAEAPRGTTFHGSQRRTLSPALESSSTGRHQVRGRRPGVQEHQQQLPPASSTPPSARYEGAASPAEVLRAAQSIRPADRRRTASAASGQIWRAKSGRPRRPPPPRSPPRRRPAPTTSAASARHRAPRQHATTTQRCRPAPSTIERGEKEPRRRRRRPGFAHQRAPAAAKGGTGA